MIRDLIDLICLTLFIAAIIVWASILHVRF